MGLSKEEQARLQELAGKDAGSLTDEEKAELADLKKKDKPLTQEAFDKLWRELQVERDAAAEMKRDLDTMKRKQKEEAKEFKPLYEEEVKAHEATKALLEQYQKATTAQFKATISDLPERVQEKLGQVDEAKPDEVLAAMSKVAEWKEMGFLDQKQDGDGQQNGDDGSGIPGGVANLSWADLIKDTALMKQVRDKHPAVYERLRKEGLRKKR